MSKTRINALGFILILIAIITLIAGVVLYRGANHHEQKQTLKIGISPPYAELLQSVADEVKTQGINVELIEFSDWQAPNIAVQNGDIDANFFQQRVFLNNAIKQTGFDLHSFAIGSGSHVGLYSKKYKTLTDLPEKARVVIPSDPVNLARALILLHRAGLIQLKDINNELSTLQDIRSNPKQLRFIEVEGPQTARAIDDAELIFGFPHYLKMAKKADPHSALFLDPTDKKYAILFVTRKDYQDTDQKLATFVHVFQNSAKVKAILDRDFGKNMWFEGWK
ncbi:MetQ/NlpA family ABC transporter substrate-binding protein [Acinetobacter rudis]|uniref:MetQ/NlpA family ABC transporter substrate-binding protein n=1 Tax=Acinetobacter rudis TaxID=632955 RepID=A0AAW8JDD0_9GAMM|nr:MetQ/NlpA family ABC transporter substrate-binding protein [Acinetobacter rudis]MDQ8936696.1 MetQ/NlpA family ABC transporter substrate-binding protein [Acinetobacter rudis]MDQ8952406.1 MetQ/NlpA family ABC transporter substrate-binding protein [Acinetobacter rudis]MDQ9018888.1 MetQ/NlpA family ABC transporter substrate-binding protein [Acinetobacter rudis]